MHKMKRMTGTTWSPASTLVILALAVSQTATLSQQYCASFNTGTGKQTASSDFMTNGKCHDQCSGYAFAVVQYKDCWCTNTQPGGAQSGSACSKACPGYPYENCGDESQGLFGYVALGPAPQSTQGASTASPSPSQIEDSSSQEQPVSILLSLATSVMTFSTTALVSAPGVTSLERETSATTIHSFLTRSLTILSQTTSPVTVQDTVTKTPSVQTISVTPSVTPETSVKTTSKFISVPIALDPATSTTSTSSTSSTTSSSSSKSSTWTPTPVVTVETVTGRVKTLTVTPTERPRTIQTVVAAVEESKSTGFFTSPGKVAGTFVAVALILVALAAGLIFFLQRRRKTRQNQQALRSKAGSGTPQRHPSRMSQMGLLGSLRGSQRERNLPGLVTSGWGPGNSADKSPADTLNKRGSYPNVVDPRLEPTAVWNPLHDNGSHISVKSFRDDQDYSRRMLKVANPDLEQ